MHKKPVYLAALLVILLVLSLGVARGAEEPEGEVGEPAILTTPEEEEAVDEAAPAEAAPAALAAATLTTSVWSSSVQKYPSGANPRFLNLAGTTAYQFSTSTPDVFTLITFNAVCSSGGREANYVDIDIVIDQGTANQIVVGPTSGSGTVLCSGNATTSASDGRVGAVISGQVRIPTPGTHTLGIKATGVGTATYAPSWRIGPFHLLLEVY